MNEFNDKKRINWHESLSISLKCPECQPYKNLTKKDWKKITRHTPDPLGDYHECPNCRVLWAILRPHTDANYRGGRNIEPATL